MSYIPLNYENINLLAGHYSPNTVKIGNNDAFDYWVRSLFQRAQSVIRIENLPEEWGGSVKDFLYYCLFRFGYVAMFNNLKFGKCFQPCGLNGFDFYYQPTKAIITNPKLKVDLKIHEECEILKLTPDYRGIWDIIERYAEKLSLIDPALNMALINSKYSLIMGSSTKAGAKFLEKVVDKVNEGNPAVIFDSSVQLPKDPVTKEDAITDLSRKDIKNTYIGTDLLQDASTILNNFDSEIGIPTIPYQKKERMVTDEAQSKIVDSTSRSLIWIDTMNESFKLINAMLDTNMEAVHNYVPDLLETGGDTNE